MRDVDHFEYLRDLEAQLRKTTHNDDERRLFIVTLNLAKAADVEEFVRRVTPEALKKAGVATELLAWVALLGVLGPVEPAFADYI